MHMYVDKEFIFIESWFGGRSYLCGMSKGASSAISVSTIFALQGLLWNSLLYGTASTSSYKALHTPDLWAGIIGVNGRKSFDNHQLTNMPPQPSHVYVCTI